MAGAMTLPHDGADPLRPQGADRTAPGAALAVLAHAALLAALALGTQWRASAPTAVSAELWAALPQAAAPRPAEPAPAPPQPAPAPSPAPSPPPAAPPAAAPPPPPQIAIEQQRRERERLAREQAERDRLAREQLERERQAREQRQQRERQAREQAQAQREARERQQREAREREQAERLAAQQRDETLRRIMGPAGATGAATATGSAARDAGPSAGYAGQIVAHIKPRIVFVGQMTGNPEAVVEVRAGPSGSVITRRIVRSSGRPDWDDAVLRAIDSAGNLPRDTDGRVPPVLIISFRPMD
jgi:colicin import membrane protein